MASELLTPAEMAEVDHVAGQGPLSGIDLMRNAGRAVAAEVLARYPAASTVHVLCGPGNNGGDGYVVARILRESGARVSLWASAAPRAGSDAAQAAAECPLAAQPLGGFRADRGSVVVDALFGAGLSKPLAGEVAAAVETANGSGVPIVAVDLPSGVSGAGGAALGPAIRAALTVTFFRLKPGHLLYPGRGLCGETLVRDIGIPSSILRRIAWSGCFVNSPDRWQGLLPVPGAEAHKYRRGHVGVFSGGVASTGAARLSALAAARAGAGAVSVLSPADALTANAAHLTSIMLRRTDDVAAVRDLVAARPGSAFVLGPGFGAGERLRDFAEALLQAHAVAALVLDADAFTAYADRAGLLFEAVAASASAVAMTPHEGEFRRLFPDIAADAELSKLDRARAAAARSGAVLVYKGPDTVIAAPDGRAAVNANGSPWLATAGSGDVLSGLVAGLLAQGMAAFEAACAAVWIHAEAGSRHGPGLIAEDLPGAVVPVLRELMPTSP